MVTKRSTNNKCHILQFAYEWEATELHIEMKMKNKRKNVDNINDRSFAIRLTILKFYFFQYFAFVHSFVH